MIVSSEREEKPPTLDEIMAEARKQTEGLNAPWWAKAGFFVAVAGFAFLLDLTPGDPTFEPLPSILTWCMVAFACAGLLRLALRGLKN